MVAGLRMLGMRAAMGLPCPHNKRVMHAATPSSRA